MLKVSEHRGKQIVKDIFKAIVRSPDLMSEDFFDLHSATSDLTEQRRVICDFIAGMTDRYAVEFYGRLYGEEPESIFKPF